MTTTKVDWRGRDNKVITLATEHVACTRHLLLPFPSKQTGYRRLRILQEQGLIRKVGEVMLQDAGRPESIFCNGWKPKYDQLRHEVMLTDFLLLYAEASNVRGWYVDSTIRPDAEMTLGDQCYFVELDSGHMSLSQITRRQRVYRDTQNLVLYVTLLSDRRVEGLRKASKAIANIALFTTLESDD